MMAMTLARDGNLSVLLPPGGQFTVKALAVLSVGLAESAAAQREQDKRDAEEARRRAEVGGYR